MGVQGVVEGELDIRADLIIDGHLVSLLIECKKHNPEFVDWIFLPKRAVYTGAPLFISQLRGHAIKPMEAPWEVEVKNSALPWNSPIVDKGDRTIDGPAAAHALNVGLFVSVRAFLLQEALEVAAGFPLRLRGYSSSGLAGGYRRALAFFPVEPNVFLSDCGAFRLYGRPVARRRC